MGDKPELICTTERFIYKDALGRTGVCKLDVFQLPDGVQVLMATERCYNPGPSVTNAIEHIVHEVYRQLREIINPLEKLIIIEHYDRLSYRRGEDCEHRFDLVTFQRTNPFGEPVWKHMPVERVRELLGDLTPDSMEEESEMYDSCDDYEESELHDDIH